MLQTVIGVITSTYALLESTSVGFLHAPCFAGSTCDTFVFQMAGLHASAVHVQMPRLSLMSKQLPFGFPETSRDPVFTNSETALAAALRGYCSQQ